MPLYGDGAPYYYGSSFANHSSLMTTGSGRLHSPMSSRFAPHLSTISESPLSTLRRFSPVTIPSRPKRIDTADIDVSTPRNLSHTENHGGGRLRRDRPTIRIRSQALKDNPALREHNEKHEKTVGELLVEKFLIKDKDSRDSNKRNRLYHQVSLDRGVDEPQSAVQKKITRRLTRRRSSADLQIDPELLAREAVLAQVQTEALDTLVAQEQAQIEVEVREGTMIIRSASKDSIQVSMLREDDESNFLDEDEKPESKIKIVKKARKKKKIPDKGSPLEDDVQDVDRKSKLHKSFTDSSLVTKNEASQGPDDENERPRNHKFKIEACNSVGDFSTLWINTSTKPKEPVSVNQFRESIKLPAPKRFSAPTQVLLKKEDFTESESETVIIPMRKPYKKDTSRNSVYLTLRPTAQEKTKLRTQQDGEMKSPVEKNKVTESKVRLDASKSASTDKIGKDTKGDIVLDTSKAQTRFRTKIAGSPENLENATNESEVFSDSPAISANDKVEATSLKNEEPKFIEVTKETEETESTAKIIPQQSKKESDLQNVDASLPKASDSLTRSNNCSEPLAPTALSINNEEKSTPLKNEELKSTELTNMSKPTDTITKIIPQQSNNESNLQIKDTSLPKASESVTVRSNAISEPLAPAEIFTNDEDKSIPSKDVKSKPTKLTKIMKETETTTKTVPQQSKNESNLQSGDASLPKASESVTKSKIISDPIAPVVKVKIDLNNVDKKHELTKAPSTLPKSISKEDIISESCTSPAHIEEVPVKSNNLQQTVNGTIDSSVKTVSKPTSLLLKNVSTPEISATQNREEDFWGEIGRQSSSPTSKSVPSSNRHASSSDPTTNTIKTNATDAEKPVTVHRDSNNTKEADPKENSTPKRTVATTEQVPEQNGTSENNISSPTQTSNVLISEQISQGSLAPLELQEEKHLAKLPKDPEPILPIPVSEELASVSELQTLVPELPASIIPLSEQPVSSAESSVTKSKASSPIMDTPVPTINIVAAPTLARADSSDSSPDEGPSTPTNEWSEMAQQMTKWNGEADLSNFSRGDDVPIPVSPNDESLDVSPAATPQTSKKKRVIKRKKSTTKKNETKSDEAKEQRKSPPASESSLKPLSEQSSPRCSPRSSPRNSPKQRPLDLIKMFYTTPGPLLTATPRDLSKVRRAKVKRKAHVTRTPSASSDSAGSARSTATTESTESSSTCTEVEEETDKKSVTSIQSNDSGFNSSPRLSNCDMACHKKCEKLTGNLCGLNQKLVAEALQALKRAPSQSSDSQRNSDSADRFQTSGRITPPATNLPRFKKYTVNDFHFLKVLGKGSFGKVLLAELRGTDCVYAVKCLKKDVVLEDDDVECTLIERKVLTLATRHPYLCHLFCTFQTESHLFFVMEYLNGGDLMFHIQKSGRFPEPRARFYAAEIWSGLNFLHKKGIVYRDLKLDNVLLDFEGHIRIADFGMCKLQIYLDRTADTFCGTPDYMAPEIIKGLKYNQAVDWWSFGILLYEMLTGQSPFSGCDEDELFWSICNERPFIPRYLSQEATDVLVCLLEKDAGKRLPGHEIAVHPFFQNLPWERLERRSLEAPFKPALEHTLDTRYFDTAFTAERPRLSPVPDQILTSMDQGVFRGFSYTNPNATD